VLVYDIWLKESSERQVFVMFSDYSRYAQVYFCVQLHVQMEIWSHRETSDLEVTWGHYQKLCGPFANLSDTCNPWKIYDVGTQNSTDDLNEVCDLNEIYLSNCLPSLTCDLYSCDHPVFCVSLCHCSI
jgi:hypothetical protein